MSQQHALSAQSCIKSTVMWMEILSCKNHQNIELQKLHELTQNLNVENS